MAKELFARHGLVVSGGVAITGSVIATQEISASAFYGNGSGISGITSSSYAVSASTSTRAVSSSYPINTINRALFSTEYARTGIIPTSSIILGDFAGNTLRTYAGSTYPTGVVIIGFNAANSASLSDTATPGVYIGRAAASASIGLSDDIIVGALAGANSFLGSNGSIAIGAFANFNSRALSSAHNIGIGRSANESSSMESVISIGELAGIQGNVNSSTVNIGYGAGRNATSSSARVNIGLEAGRSTVGDDWGINIGSNSGRFITASNSSINIGRDAGSNVTRSLASINLGWDAGRNVVGANNNTNIGYQAGAYSTGSTQAINIGYTAGAYTTTAPSHSINIGYGSGYSGATKFSINIGTWTSYPINETPIGENTIVIGNNISAPFNVSNFLNIGGVLFATGTHADDFLNEPNTITSSLSSVAKVGILTPYPKYTLDVSGSGNFSNGLTVTGSLNATVAQATSASYAVSASWAPSSGGGGGGLPTRQFTHFTSVSNIGYEQIITGSVSLALAFILYQVRTSQPIRLRLYSNTANRDVDLLRGINVEPTGSHGVILDVVTTSATLTASLAPFAIGANLNDPATTNIPFSMTGLQTGSVAVSASILYLPLE